MCLLWFAVRFLPRVTAMSNSIAAASSSVIEAMGRSSQP
jgi:hypothetical protein